MDKKILRFLEISIGIIFAFCIAVFAWMISRMHEANEESMKQVCQLYMSEMSGQIQSHFASVIELQLELEKVIVRRYDPGETAEFDQLLQEEMISAAKIHDYMFVAFYSQKGDLDVLYGPDVTIINEPPFLESLLEGEDKVVAGVTKEGDVVLLLGTQAAYPMRDGSRSVALVVGLPIGYVNQTLSLPSDESLVYSHIIRKDGSFVLQNDNNHANNYYGWLLNEGEFDSQTAQQIVLEMKTANENEEDYSVIVDIDGQRRNIYCEPLDKTEWVLVTVMLHGRLDTAVYDLGRKHLRDAIAACTLILLLLLCIFVAYFRMSFSQMKRLAAARQEAEEASKAKSNFLSNMSHDIRTPMNAIVGMTSIATSNLEKPEVVQECLRKVTLSSKHLLGLINDVLDMSKIESGKLTLSFQEISLRDSFENIVNIVTPQIKEKQLNFDIFIRNVRYENVFCDDVRLNQVLINLLSNAVKFTPEGGSVSVTLCQEDSPLGETHVRTHIKVKDTGIGMSEEFAKTVFEAFTREDNARVSHTEGTGLGMAITKYIIDQMKGTIEVESEQGKGTQFHVTLDLEKAQVQEKEMSLTGHGKVLVVDDDEQMCLGAVSNLEEIGLLAEWTKDTEEAVRMVREHHESGQDYQVIMVDWQMPQINGIEAARRMRAYVGEDVPVLMMSAYDWSDVEEEAKGAGITGFISKPLFKSTLYHGLRPYMDEDYEAGKEAEDENSDEDKGEEKRLLVAEDYDMNWEIIETLLPNYGYQVERAENGEICVEKFKASEVAYYAGILMDIRMPVMNGYEATQEIRKCDREDAGLPIIAMTADAFSDDVHRCLECGMNAHVAKPIDMHELLGVLKKFL